MLCLSRQLKMNWLKQVSNLSNLKEAVRATFSRKSSLIAFFIGAILFGSLNVYIPIFVTPGNSFGFFLEITPWWGFLIVISLSLLMGLLVAMQVYAWKMARELRKREVGSGAVAGVSSFVAGMFSSATCASCVSALFSFLLPPAGIFALLKYRWWITAGGIGLVLLSLMMTSRRIANDCASCKVVVESGRTKRKK